jgi:hypothetical protein
MNTEGNNVDNSTESNELTNLQMIEKLKGSDELNTLIKNANESFWKSNIGSEVKNIYTNFDNSISTHLGLEKPEDIKTSDWVNTHIKQLAETKKELETLKSSKGQENEAQTKLWNDKFSKLKAENANLQKLLESEKVNSFKTNISNQLDNYLVGKSFKSTYSDDDINTLVGAKKNKIISNTRQLENGKVAVYNPANDSYYLDPLGEPLTPQQVAEKEFSSMFESKKTGGATPTDTKTATIEGDVVAVNMNGIKTKQDFYQEFNKIIAPKGLASHSEEYLKIQRATMAHYNINSLPLA